MPTARRRPERKPVQRYTVNDYLNETINYGGELRSRGSVIAEMQRDGLTPREIDYWMIGYDHSMKMRQERNPLSAGQRDQRLLREMEELYRRTGRLRTDLRHDIGKDTAERRRTNPAAKALPPGHRWRKIGVHNSWVAGASITESVMEGSNVTGWEPRRFTATIRGYGNWYLGTHRPEDAQLVVERARRIRDRIDEGDETVFHVRDHESL